MSKLSNNPLYNIKGLPAFSSISPEHIEPVINYLLAQNRNKLQSLLTQSHYTWQNLIQPIEDMEEQLAKTWSPVSHLNSVANTDELRAAYNACLPKLSDYATEMGQNRELFDAYKSIKTHSEFSSLETAQKKIIDNALRDFKLSGIGLAQNEQQRYKEIRQRLTKLGAQFSENVLDATQGWHKHITNKALLKGLPETALAVAQQAAQSHDLPGYVFTLEFPSYYAIMTYADDRALREEFYRAYGTRASDQGPTANQWDNSNIITETLALRHELAQLLGFQQFAEKSLATKMAKDTGQVIDFLENLAARAHPAAKLELQELQQWANQATDITNVKSWDIGWLSEKYRQQKFQLSEEELRPYFPANKVTKGLFTVVKKLYGLKISEIENVDVWHSDVSFYEIRDQHNNLRGQFYLDLYTRKGKRGGAWMDSCITRKRLNNSVENETAPNIQTPVAYLICNFTPAVDDKPSLLTHNEVITLFHEFGHGLHHMLTQVDYISVSGIEGVPWDAVELPSQFMENWCWEQQALNLFAIHNDTSEVLPDNLYQRMDNAKNFQRAMGMVRQLEFALFDFKLHLDYDPSKECDAQKLITQIREQVAVIQAPSSNRFQNSFSHIFAGGYAAGYYSYLWAEVLSADAFSAFKGAGIFDRDTGQRFLHSILEKGGTYEPMKLFIDFRGREPKIEALLQQAGLIERQQESGVKSNKDNQ